MALDPIKSFRLLTVKLKNATLETSDDIGEMEISAQTSTIETKRWVDHIFMANASGDQEILKAIVSLGIRLVKGSPEVRQKAREEGVEPEVIYIVEAALAAEFLVKNHEFGSADLQHFLEANAVHVVWPFWREHVFSTLRAASLPLAEIPLMPAVARSPTESTQRETQEVERAPSSKSRSNA